MRNEEGRLNAGPAVGAEGSTDLLAGRAGSDDGHGPDVETTGSSPFQNTTQHVVIDGPSHEHHGAEYDELEVVQDDTGRQLIPEKCQDGDKRDAADHDRTENRLELPQEVLISTWLVHAEYRGDEEKDRCGAPERDHRRVNHFAVGPEPLEQPESNPPGTPCRRSGDDGIAGDEQAQKYLVAFSQHDGTIDLNCVERIQ